MSEPLVCTPKRLPDHLIVPAAVRAVQINPVNRPAVARFASLTRSIEATPERIAFLTTKYWGAGGVNLTVGFLDNPPVDLRARILLHMNAWNREANIRFTASNTDPQVRIARSQGGGYWSYLGTDIETVPADEQTMNLDSFTMQTPDSEFYRVVRHETGHCLVGDTFIDGPRDLEKYPLGIPIRDLVGQQPWVYAWKDGKIVVRKASRVWLSKQAAPIIRVKLSPGLGPKNRMYLPPQELVGTSDHPVLLSDGVTWKNLGDLRSGDRVCSMYRQANGERSRIQWTGCIERIREHVFVCEEVYGTRPEKHDAHHRNERKLDQTPENLEWKSEFAHHSDHSKGKKLSDEHKAKLIECNRTRVYTDEMKEQAAERSRNQSPITDEGRAKLSVAAKGRPQSPETLEKRRASMERFYASGGRSGMYGKTVSEETRAKRSASMKATLARKRGETQEGANHVVVSIESAGFADVYDMTVPDAESFVANGVIVHNCLGCPHEHMRAELVAMIDPNKAIRYFGATQGWSKREVIQQVLTPLDDADFLLATRNPEQDSIMCYQLPGSIMKDGKPVLGGADITDDDYAFAGLVYPQPRPI